MAYSKIRGPKKRKNKTDEKQGAAAKDAFQTEGRRFMDQVLEHPMFIVGTVAAIILIVAVSVFISNYIDSTHSEKADMYADALVAWSGTVGEESDYDSEHDKMLDVVEKFTAVQKNLPDTIYAESADLYIARAHFILSEYGKAADHFKRLRNASHISEKLKFGGYEGEAFCYHDRGEHKKAAAVWEQYLSDARTDFYKDYAMYYTARAYEKAGEEHIAIGWYRKLSDTYPDSALTAEVKSKLPADDDDGEKTGS